MNLYSPERKEAVLRKVLPPQSRSVSEVAQEEGIPYHTVYHWLKRIKANGNVVSKSTSWSAEKKFAVIIETATLTESEWYCQVNLMHGSIDQ